MNVLIAGGGTGGHLFPALAIADALAQRSPGVGITMVGTSRGLEARWPMKWELRMLSSKPIKGRSWIDRLSALGAVVRGMWESLRLIREKKPALVIGVGGYATGPLVLTAALLGIPTMIQEQNAHPGLTNRILSRVVRRVCVTFPDSKRFFPANKCVNTGNPVRSDVMTQFDHARRKTDLFTVLIFGGSQGAKRLNQAMIDALVLLVDYRKMFRVIHQVGKEADIQAIETQYAAAGVDAEVTPFIYDMGQAYADADFVICRSGAGSISELALFRKPSLLVPYPYAADDHQSANARYLEKTGGAVVMNDAEVNGTSVASIIQTLLTDSARRSAMVKALEGLGWEKAADRIVDEGLALIK